MKKNVKYIGSAIAVALLAAGSPVIIPMLVPTTVVNAAPVDDSNPIDYSPTEDAKTYLQDFKNQFKDIYVASSESLAKPLSIFETPGYLSLFPYFNASGNGGSGAYIFDMQGDHGMGDSIGMQALKAVPNPNINFKDSAGAYIFRDLTIYVSVSDPESKDNPATADHPAGAEDLSSDTAVANYVKKLRATDGTKITYPITVTIHLGTDLRNTNYTDATKTLNGIPDDLKTFSFTINSSRLDLTSDTTKPAINTGSNFSSSNAQEGNSTLKVTDNYSAIKAMNGIETPLYSQSVFSSEQAALDAADDDGFNPKSDNLGDVQLDNGKIVTPGSYFQTVSYKLSSDPKTGDTALNNMLSGATDKLTGTTVAPYDTFIDGKKGTDKTNYALNKTYLTIVRPVTVSGGTLSANVKPIQS